MELNQDQLQQLHLLGIDIQNSNDNNISPLNQGEMSQSDRRVLSKKSFPVFPLLSISGITLLSFSGLILLKNKSQNITQINNTNTTLPETSVSPTQVPKSIQHYLLTSQQYFSSALQSSTSNDNQRSTIDDLNNSILAATQAIKEFPSDYRGFFQRGRIYQSLLASQPQLVDQALADLNQALKLNSNNAEITRSLASLYAFKGDAQNTISYLAQTINLEPTKAQNFYDLAKIQQQIGLLPDALKTYNQLITIVTDPNQKSQIESEKTSIEKIIAQNPDKNYSSSSQNSNSNNNDLSPTIYLDSPTIQAMGTSDLIIADSQTIDQVKISNITDSNALSGTATLLANQIQITIENKNLTDTSQVYVTAIKGGKNQNLQVLSKSNDSYVVGLPKAISEDIQFKWWIIN